MTKRAVASRAAAEIVEEKAAWTFLSNHGHVLLCLAQEPELLMREVAERVGISVRAVQRIVADLEDAGYLEREKDGRRNRYRVKRSKHLRHPIEAHNKVSQLLKLVEG